jgi:hypothetical protein
VVMVSDWGDLVFIGRKRKIRHSCCLLCRCAIDRSVLTEDFWKIGPTSESCKTALETGGLK